jgi:hypothetical protein
MLFAKYHTTRTVPKGRFVFFARDGAVHKGSSTDITAVSARLAVGYDTAGTIYDIPTGAYDGTRGWVTNSLVAKYVNRAAELLDPVRVTIVKPGRTVKLQARNSGLGVTSPPPANSDVVVCYTITNAARSTASAGAGPPAPVLTTCTARASRARCSCSSARAAASPTRPPVRRPDFPLIRDAVCRKRSALAD